MLPKISIITVSKNAVETIEKTIQSVLEQTYSNIEYIVIDGISTDGTLEIVNHYKEKINLIIVEKDSGIFDAMNKGIALATGELVCFLNANDYYISPFAIESVINRMYLDRCDIFYAQILWVDPSQSSIIVTNHRHIRDKFQLYKECFPHPATFYKKSAFEKIGVLDLDYPYLADYEWNIRALLKFNLAYQYIEIVIAAFTVGGYSTITEHQKNRDAELFVLRQNYFSTFQMNLFKYRLSTFFYKKRIVLRIFRRIFKLKINKIY